MRGPPRGWVLDTNVVLDWLVFGDAHMLAAGAWLRDGRARWLHSSAMLDELFDVVARDRVLRHADADAASLVRRVQEASRAHGVLLPAAAPCALRCRDPDDQMFIDLAMHAGASLLLTRDKALLELARPGPHGGPRVVRPAELALEPGACA